MSVSLTKPAIAPAPTTTTPKDAMQAVIAAYLQSGGSVTRCARTASAKIGSKEWERMIRGEKAPVEFVPEPVAAVIVGMRKPVTLRAGFGSR